MATNTPELCRHERVTGPRRIAVGAQLCARYEGGASIRAIRDETGYSIGRVRGLLLEAGVSFRGRGGNHRRSAPTDTAQ